MNQSCARCGLLHPAGTPCFSLALAGDDTGAALRPGALLAGRYLISRLLHRGGMSVIYLAEDRIKHAAVALKELRLPEGATAEEAREAEVWFARESYLLSSLRHPLIPAFYSVFHEAGRSYIVQEYVQGENLDELVRRLGPQDPRSVVAWGRLICELLAYLHRQAEPVVFRDLKPANILLRPDGRLAVVDFGIARPYSPGAVGTVIGSPGYAPPEQYQGLATPQSDLYALGATLHRLLTAYDPEQGTPFTFPLASALNPHVCVALAATVAQALRLAPEQRFPSAGTMGSALRESLARGRAMARQAPPDRPWIQYVLPFVGALLLIPILGLWALGGGHHRQGDFSSLAFNGQPQNVLPTLSSPIVYPAPKTPRVTHLRPLTMGCVWQSTNSLAGANMTGASMAAGPDGALWLTSAFGSGIIRVSPAGRLTSCQFPVSQTTSPDLNSVAAGPDGAMWFTSSLENWVGRLTPDGKITVFQLPADGCVPGALVRGPDGNLWFLDLACARLSRLSPSGALTVFPLHAPPPANSWDMQPGAVTAGPDGAIWFTEPSINAIDRLSTSGSLTEYPLPSNGFSPAAITVGPDRNLWFTESGADQLGSITPGGVLRFHDLSAMAWYGGGAPDALAAGPDGTLWYTEDTGTGIGRIRPDGALLSPYVVPWAGFQPTLVVKGTGGAMWLGGPRLPSVVWIGADDSFRLFPG